MPTSPLPQETRNFLAKMQESDLQKLSLEELYHLQLEAVSCIGDARDTIPLFLTATGEEIQRKHRVQILERELEEERRRAVSSAREAYISRTISIISAVIALVSVIVSVLKGGHS